MKNATNIMKEYQIPHFLASVSMDRFFLGACAQSVFFVET